MHIARILGLFWGLPEAIYGHETHCPCRSHFLRSFPHSMVNLPPPQGGEGAGGNSALKNQLLMGKQYIPLAVEVLG